jgi:hypothetical protein
MSEATTRISPLVIAKYPGALTCRPPSRTYELRPREDGYLAPDPRGAANQKRRTMPDVMRAIGESCSEYT